MFAIQIKLDSFPSENIQSIINLAILRAKVRISNFPIQIWILLKKWVKTQVEPSQLENIHSIIDLAILRAKVGISNFPIQIWILLKKWV